MPFMRASAEAEDLARVSRARIRSDALACAVAMEIVQHRWEGQGNCLAEKNRPKKPPRKMGESELTGSGAASKLNELSAGVAHR